MTDNVPVAVVSTDLWSFSMAAAASPHAEIRADAVYPLPDFQRITGLGPRATRAAQRDGLKVVRVGRRSYVQGKSFLEYLEKKAQPVA